MAGKVTDGQFLQKRIDCLTELSRARSRDAAAGLPDRGPPAPVGGGVRLPEAGNPRDPRGGT